MFTIEEINDMLDEIAAELPEGVFRDLNGGVCLLMETKRSSKDPDGGLYTLGEYRRDQMGRYINIYYGSLIKVYGNTSNKKMHKHLKDVLVHELTHHLESLAGDRSLEIKDEINLVDYFSRKTKR
ncbi:MAG: metallopeptidase family protein [Oscillospiraceae bacterium]|nr:metallopeptidase family protein [Oscillospiraceae bacterium]